MAGRHGMAPSLIPRFPISALRGSSRGAQCRRRNHTPPEYVWSIAMVDCRRRLVQMHSANRHAGHVGRAQWCSFVITLTACGGSIVAPTGDAAIADSAASMTDAAGDAGDARPGVDARPSKWKHTW